MNMHQFLWDAAKNKSGALPILMETTLNSTWKMWVDVQGADINAHIGSGYTNSAARIYVQVWYVK